MRVARVTYQRFLLRAWVSADAATLLAVFDELGLLKIFDAFEATDFDVNSGFLGIYTSFRFWVTGRENM